jgi:hypothetical protein
MLLGNHFHHSFCRLIWLSIFLWGMFLGPGLLQFFPPGISDCMISWPVRQSHCLPAYGHWNVAQGHLLVLFVSSFLQGTWLTSTPIDNTAGWVVCNVYYSHVFKGGEFWVWLTATYTLEEPIAVIIIPERTTCVHWMWKIASTSSCNARHTYVRCDR